MPSPTPRRSKPFQAQHENVAGPDDDRSIRGPIVGSGTIVGPRFPMTSDGSAARRFRHALAGGSPRLQPSQTLDKSETRSQPHVGTVAAVDRPSAWSYRTVI